MEKQEERTNLYSLLFVGIGVVNGISMFLEGYMFGKSGENLTLKLRDGCFRSLLRQVNRSDVKQTTLSFTI